MRRLLFIHILLIFLAVNNKTGICSEENNFLNSASSCYYNKKYIDAITILNANYNSLKPKEKFLLGMSLKNINELANSESVFKEILDSSVLLKPLIQFHLGDIKKKQKKYAESNDYLLKLFNSGAAKFPRLEKETLFKISENFNHLKDWNSSEKYYKILMEKHVNDYSYYKDVFLNIPVKPDIMLEIFRIKYSKKNFEEGFAVLEEIINKYSSSDAAFAAVNILDRNSSIFSANINAALKFKIAKIKMNKGQFSGAASLFKEIFDEHIQKNALEQIQETVYLLGLCYYKLRTKEGYGLANQYFEMINKYFPNSNFAPQSLFYRGIIEQKSDNIDSKLAFMYEIINKFDNAYYSYSAFMELIEYYSEKNDIPAINSLFSQALEYFNSKKQNEYLIKSLWQSAFYAYKHFNYPNALELMNLLNEKIPLNDKDELLKTYFWLYKINEKLSNTKTALEYAEKIAASEDYNNYHYWRILELTGINSKTGFKFPLKSVYQMTEENLIKELETIANNNDLFSILASIKDFKNLELVLEDNQTAAPNYKKLKLLMLYLNKSFNESISYVSNFKNQEKNELAQFLYPEAYKSYIEKYSGIYEIETPLPFAIMREESRFSSSVVSSAGAIGLMQIMPKTGKDISSKINVRNFKADLLYEPSYNIQFGVYELKRLYDKWFNMLKDKTAALAFTIASYNAGETAVRRWKPILFDKYSDVDLFMESIPYKETRGYVNRVLRSYYIYKTLEEK